MNKEDFLHIDLGLFELTIGWRTAAVVGVSVALICFAIYH